MQLLARNQVKDYDHWRKVFDAQSEASHDSGLKVLQMWRAADDPNDVFFLFSVEDRARAEAYMSTPEAAAVGEESGVLGGEYHFLNPVP